MSVIAPTRFYLCHHISLSGAKAALMTRRLLALCFGSPVNVGRADGISPAKASLLSVYNNVALCCHPHGDQPAAGLRRLTPRQRQRQRQRRAGSGRDVDGVPEREESVVTIVSKAEFPSQTSQNRLNMRQIDSLSTGVRPLSSKVKINHPAALNVRMVAGSW